MSTVLEQSFEDFELIVVDDGSTDETPAVVEAVDDARVRYVHQTNQRLSVARNTGVACSTGRYVLFLDDDDLALPRWLERFAASIDGDPAVVSCGERLAKDDGTIVDTTLPGQLGPGFAEYKGWFLPGTFIVRRDAYEAAGGFTPGLPHLHQTEFALRLLPICRANGWDVRTIPEPLIQRHIGGDQRVRRGTTPAYYDSINYIVTAHRDQIARSGPLLARYSAVAGVAAARIGDFPAARHHLATSVRAQPRAWKYWARLGLACVPPIGRAVWSRSVVGARGGDV